MEKIVFALLLLLFGVDAQAEARVRCDLLRNGLPLLQAVAPFIQGDFQNGEGTLNVTHPELAAHFTWQGMNVELTLNLGQGITRRRLDRWFNLWDQRFEVWDDESLPPHARTGLRCQLEFDTAQDSFGFMQLLDALPWKEAHNALEYLRKTSEQDAPGEEVCMRVGMVLDGKAWLDLMQGLRRIEQGQPVFFPQLIQQVTQVNQLRTGLGGYCGLGAPGPQPVPARNPLALRNRIREIHYRLETMRDQLMGYSQLLAR